MYTQFTTCAGQRIARFTADTASVNFVEVAC